MLRFVPVRKLKVQTVKSKLHNILVNYTLLLELISKIYHLDETLNRGLIAIACNKSLYIVYSFFFQMFLLPILLSTLNARFKKVTLKSVDIQLRAIGTRLQIRGYEG